MQSSVQCTVLVIGESPSSSSLSPLSVSWDRDWTMGSNGWDAQMARHSLQVNKKRRYLVKVDLRKGIQHHPYQPLSCRLRSPTDVAHMVDWSTKQTTTPNTMTGQQSATVLITLSCVALGTRQNTHDWTTKCHRIHNVVMHNTFPLNTTWLDNKVPPYS